MNDSRTPFLAGLTLLLTPVVSLLGQGSLVPPGPPGPTMKTLDQVEPQIPVPPSGTIDSPGSYYLTGNRTDEMTIQSSNVSLDLRGYTLSQTEISVYGGYQNVKIFNGFFNDSGLFADSFVEVRDIGFSYSSDGIVADEGAWVENCRFFEVNRAVWINGTPFSGTSTVKNSRFVGGNGGVESSGESSLLVEGCEFTSVSEGIVANSQNGSTMTLLSNRFSECQDAIQLRGDGAFTISGCQISRSNNRAISIENTSNGGMVLVESTVFYDNHGALFADQDESSFLVIDRCTFSGNQDGVEVWRETVISDSVFRGNHDAVHALVGLEIVNTRFSRNTGMHVIRFGDSGTAVLNGSVLVDDHTNGPLVFSPLPLMVNGTRASSSHGEDAISAASVWMQNSVIKADGASAIRIDSPNDAFDNRVSSSLVVGEPAIDGNGVQGMEILSSRIRGFIDEGGRTVPDQGQLHFNDQLTMIDSMGPEIDFRAGPGSVIRGNTFDSLNVSGESNVVRGNSAKSINGATDSPLFGPIIYDDSPSGDPSANADHPGANFILLY